MRKLSWWSAGKTLVLGLVAVIGISGCEDGGSNEPRSSDTTPPVTLAAPGGGTYNNPQDVVLSCDDGTGSGCTVIYYTMDGTTPNTSSNIYSGAISIGTENTTELKFFSVDQAGNDESVKTRTYTIVMTLLVRNPYLQNVTQTSIDVLWGTDNTVTNGTLYWGDSPGNYPNSVSSISSKTPEDHKSCDDLPDIPPYSNRVHTATIGGLTSGQTVYYYVSTGGVTVGLNDDSYKATTAPANDASFRFIAYGDSRPDCKNFYPANNARARVIEAMSEHNPDIVLHMGDIAINGMLHQFDKYYFAPTAPLSKNTPFFTTLGNHDIRTSGNITPYRMVFSLPTNNVENDGTEDYYSFDYGPLHFVSLNTELLSYSGNFTGSRNYATAEELRDRADEMLTWLEEDLDAVNAVNPKPWKVIFFHRQYYIPEVIEAWDISGDTDNLIT